MVMPSWAPASCRLRLRIGPHGEAGRGAAAPRPSPRASCAGWRSGRTRPPRRSRWPGAGPPRRPGCGPSRRRLGAFAVGRPPQADRSHPVPVELGHLEAPAVELEALADLGDPSEPSEDEPGRASRSPPRALGTRRRRRPRRRAACRSSSHSPARCTTVSSGTGRSCSSSISPTISSSTSSRVMIPAVPPCSSTTTARWLPTRRRSARRSARSRVSGTTKAGTISEATGVRARSS